jgi:hypothetical protein
MLTLQAQQSCTTERVGGLGVREVTHHAELPRPSPMQHI